MIYRSYSSFSDGSLLLACWTGYRTGTRARRKPRELNRLTGIDMQRAFLEPGAALEAPPGRAIIPNLQRLIQACRLKGVPVAFTEFVYSPAVPCLRGDPIGPEHLPARPGEPTGIESRPE